MLADSFSSLLSFYLHHKRIQSTKPCWQFIPGCVQSTLPDLTSAGDEQNARHQHKDSSVSFLTSSGQFGFVRSGFLLAVPFNFSWRQISALCLGLHSPTAPKQCHCPVYISTLFFSFISITMGCEQGQVCSTTAEYSCLLSLQNFKVRKKPSKTQTTKKTTNSFRREITQKAFSPLILLLGISPIGVAYSSAYYREKGKRHAIH